jgi:hypothetical protein
MSGRNQGQNEVECPVSIIVDETSTVGHFTWKLKSTTNENKGNSDSAQNKYQLFTDLGLLPDNGILSRKLANIFGQSIYREIYKQREISLWQEYIGNPTTGTKHDDYIKDNRSIEAWLNNKHDQISLSLRRRMVEKFKALEEIDLFVNKQQTTPDDVTAAINKIEQKLNNLYTNLKQVNSALLNSIVTREQLEQKYLTTQLDELKNALLAISDTNEEARNTLIQQWQKDTFNKLIQTFNRNQGEIDCHRKLSPTESDVYNTTQDAFYAIQWHTPRKKQSTITSETLWRIDEETTTAAAAQHTESKPSEPDEEHSDPSTPQHTNNNAPDVLLTHQLTNKPTSDLLFGALLCEKLQGNLPIGNLDFSLSNNENNNSVVTAIQDTITRHKTTKKMIKDATINAKDKIKKEKRNAETNANDAKTGNNSESINKPNTLETTSHFTRNLLALMYTRNYRETLRTKALDNLKGVMAVAPAPVAADTDTLDTPDAKLSPHQEIMKEIQAGQLRTQPLVDHDVAALPTEAIQSFISPFDELFGFIEKDLGAKRPFVFTLTFWNLYIQFGGAVLAGFWGLPHLASHLVSVEESAVLKPIFGHACTTANIERGVATVNNGIEWGTAATGFELFIVSGFGLAKLGFTLGDLVNLSSCGGNDNLIQEFINKSSSALEGRDRIEKGIGYAKTFVGSLALMGLASLVGVGGYYNPSFLGMLAEIPPQMLAPHGWLQAVQTMGAVKTASLLIAKASVCYDTMSNGLLNAKGEKLSEAEGALLKRFMLLLRIAAENNDANTKIKAILENQDSINLIKTSITANQNLFEAVFSPQMKTYLETHHREQALLPDSFECRDTLQATTSENTAITSDDKDSHSALNNFSVPFDKLHIQKKITDGSLVNIDGVKIKVNDSNHQILKYFIDCYHNPNTAPIDKKNKDYTRVKRVFEDLLFMNPSLKSLFTNINKLNELGVKEIKHAWYKTVPASIARSALSLTVGPLVAIATLGGMLLGQIKSFPPIVTEIFNTLAGTANVMGNLFTKGAKAVIQPPLRVISSLAFDFILGSLAGCCYWAIGLYKNGTQGDPTNESAWAKGKAFGKNIRNGIHDACRDLWHDTGSNIKAAWNYVTTSSGTTVEATTRIADTHSRGPVNNSGQAALITTARTLLITLRKEGESANAGNKFSHPARKNIKIQVLEKMIKATEEPSNDQQSNDQQSNDQQSIAQKMRSAWSEKDSQCQTEARAGFFTSRVDKLIRDINRHAQRKSRSQPRRVS